MLTLNQIKHRLINYLNSHAQINEVVFADDFNFAAERNLSYPIASLEWVESNISGKALNHTYKIILADKTNSNIKNIDDDIESDLMLVADDFFAWLQDQEGFDLVKSSQIVKLTDQYADRISGIGFRIILSTIRRQDDCVTPRKI